MPASPSAITPAAALPAHERTRLDAALVDAFEHLSLINPALAGLVRTVPHRIIANGPAIAFASATACYYTPAVADLTPAERCGVIVHEYCHVALSHASRAAMIGQHAAEGCDRRVFNIAADLMINTWIGDMARHADGWIALPDNAVSIGALQHLGVGNALATLPTAIRCAILSLPDLAARNVEIIYAVLREFRDANQALALTQPYEGDLVDDGERPRDEASAASAQLSQSAIVRHAGTALAGQDSWGVIDKILAQLPNPLVNWRKALRGVVATHAASETRVTATRRSRRMPSMPPSVPFMPGKVREDKPRIVGIVDTSASVPDAVLRQFTGELYAAARMFDVDIVALEADVEVCRASVVTPLARPVAPVLNTGRGGTDFTAALRHADGLAPDVIVYLTDLEAPPPKFRPRAPVYWCATGDCPAPFGRVIRILPSS